MAEQLDSGSVVFLKSDNSGPPTAVRISRQQKILIDTFLETGLTSYAVKMAAWDYDNAVAFMKRPEIDAYIQTRLVEMAAANGVTKESVMAAVGALLKDRNMEATQAHLKALDIAAKILRLVQPNLHLHQNVPEKTEFADMNDEQFYAEWEKRMNYRGASAPRLSQGAKDAQA